MISLGISIRSSNARSDADGGKRGALAATLEETCQRSLCDAPEGKDRLSLQNASLPR